MSARTKVLLAVGVVVIAACGAALFAWFVWLVHMRPGLDDSQVYGIDVSHHQGPIDWEAVAADDIEFAIIKATEGGDWVDTRFAENWSGANDAGIEVGAYHFFRTCTDGALQAQNVLSIVPADSPLPIAIDVEGGGRCGEGVTNEDIRRELVELVELVEAERGPVIFYVLEGFDEFEDVFAGRERWVRSLGFAPSEPEWFVWQQSNRAAIDGIEGPVDLNVMNVGRK